MRKMPSWLCLLVALIVFPAEFSVAAAPAAAGKATVISSIRSPQAAPQAVPRYFEQNLGQWPAAQAFRAYGFGYSVTLGNNSLKLQFAAPTASRAGNPAARSKQGTPPAVHDLSAQPAPPREVSLRFEGASSTSQFTGVDPLAAKGAWFAGREQDWRSNISLYQRVRLSEAYPGVDATFYGRDGQFEYDLNVAPGANTSALVLDLDGADQAVIGKDGNLAIEVDGQKIVLHKPLAWQPSAAIAGQTRQPVSQLVEVSYALLPADASHARRIGLKLGQYDSTRPLTIDPVLTFATYLTSATSALPDYYVVDLTVDSANNVYVLSTDQSNSSMTVQKLSPAGALLYTSTFASKDGTSNNLYPVMIRVNASGQAYIAASDRGNFPTTASGYQPSYPNNSYGGAFNAALAVLSATGATLAYSTYFGGTANGSYGPDYAFALAVDASGNAYLAGQAGGGSFPTTAGVLQSSYKYSHPAAFLAKFNPAASGAASLLYSTLLGDQYTSLNGVAIDASGDAYLAVADNQCSYEVAPTSGALSYSGSDTTNYCGYVTELNPTASAVVYSAYLGPGTPTAVAVDGSQNAYVTGGYVYSSDFPTTPGAYQTTNPDGFALELNSTGALVYSTFLSGPSGISGTGKVYPSSIALQPGCASACTAYISGQTLASDLPVINGLGGAPPTVGQGNNYAGFLVALNGTGSAALTSGYLNGLTSFQDLYSNGVGNSGQGQYSGYTPHVAVDANGNAWLAGSIYSGTPDFPVTTAGAAGPSGSWLAEVSLSSGGNIVAVPNSVAFGTSVPVNVSSTAYNGAPTTILLRNMGSAPVTIDSIVPSSPVFSETDNCNGQIAAASFCTATVVFTPATDSPATGTLNIASTGIVSPLVVPLSGQGADAGFVLASPTSLSFGNVAQATVSAPQTVTFTNAGDEPVTTYGNYIYANLAATGFSQVNDCPYTLPPGASCQAQITFAPGANLLGPQSATMSPNYGNPWSVALSGTALLPTGSGGPLGVELTSTALNFGTETVGVTSPSQAALLVNSGSQPLNLQSAAITLTSTQGSASDFAISGNLGAQVLAPAAYQYFSVTFTPSVAATETATLSIPVQGAASPYTVTLIGQGAAATRIIEFQPGNWIFPDQVVGTPSSPTTFAVYNSGSAPFAIDRVLVTGDFSVSSQGCTGGTLPPATAPGVVNNQSCSINVVFNPSQAGPRTGTLTVVDAASATPQTIPLSGNGIVAVGSASVTPTQLDFGVQNKATTSAIQNVTITNQGTEAITVTGAATTGDYAAAQANSSCGVLPYTMNPGGSCYFGVTFTPTVTTSPDNGTLTIQTSAGPQTATLTGAGQAATLAALTSPSSINFGNVQASATTSVPVYVTNTGTETLKFTGGTTLPGVYSLSDGCNSSGGGTLNPGQDCVLTVNFNPTGATTYTGNMTIRTNAGNLTVALSGTGTPSSGGSPTQFSPAVASFDQQAVNSISAPMTITFTYGGASSTFALTGASITSGSSAFQLATGINALNNCSANVGSTTTCQVNVVFAPTAAGLQTGTLTVASTVGNFAATLSGYAPPFSDTGYLSPGALNYPAQIVSTTSSYQLIYLYNTGAAAFTVGNIGGTNFGPTSEFQVDPNSYGDQCSNMTLNSADNQTGVGGSCYIGIQFAPSASGTRSGVLSIPVTYADGSRGSFTATLAGQGIAQKNNAVLTPTILAFPDTAVGTTGSTYVQTVTVTNSGNLPFTVGALTGTNATVGASTAGEFSVTVPGATDQCSGTTVAVGGSCYISLGFLPTAAGAQTGSITFPITYANATTSTPLTLALSGKGIAANPSIAFSPTGAQFGPVTAGFGNSNSYTNFTATNNGNVPITFTKYVISTGFTVSYDGCTGVTVNPGQGCYYQVYFNPASSSAGTTFNGTLAAYDTAPGSPQTAALNGISIAPGSQLNFSQTAINFGAQQTGVAGNQVNIYLVNQGNRPDTITSIGLSGTNHPDFTESDNCAGAALQPASSCTISLIFTPGAAGARTATLKETDSFPGSGRTVTLTGTGVAAYAGVELFPTALAFSTQQTVGEGSSQQFFSVTNTGPNPLVIGQIKSSDPVQFPITEDGCSSQTISTGQNCVIGILFAPSSAGAHTANISIPDNAAGSPQLEPVSGTGVSELTSAITLAASQSSVAFGAPVALTASVKDQNGKPLTNGQVTFLNGKTVLGTAQVVSNPSGGKTVGTATLNTILIPLGANSLTATYKGGDAVSTSAPTTVTVTGTYPTTTTFAASGAAGDYTFVGTVSGAGPIAPTGSVTFTDGTTQLVPGTVALNPTTLTQTFVASPEVNGLTSPQVVASADVNGDGIPDLLTGTSGNGITVQLGNGDGTFRTPSSFFANGTIYSIAFGDFNGDGKLDIVASTYSAIGVLLGNGDGTFQENASAYDGGSIESLVVGDFNGDGKLDILATNNTTNTLDLLLGNGDGTFQPPVSFQTGGQYQTSVAIGDINGDGKLDAVVANYSNSTIGILLGNGNGTFQTATTVATQTNYEPPQVSLADLRGVGKLDLIVNDANHTDIGVFLGNGNGTFQAEQTVANNSYYVGQVVAADLNGDGKLDLAVADNGNNAIDVFFGKGDGTFPTEVSYPVGQNPYGVALADFNHDGRPDIASANYSGNSDTIYLNHVFETATLSNTVVPGTGTHPVTGVYAGDPNFAPSTSNTLQLTATLITPTMTLAAEPNSTLAWQQQLSLSIALTGAYSFVPAPSGAVSYSIDGGTPQPATLSSGSVVIPISQLSVGAHSIAVTYPGDPYYTKPAAQSLAVTIVKANQTITFPQLPSVTYGAAPVTLAATASSQLPVAFTVISGPATLTNGVLTVTGAGSITVAANQNGNVDWNAAPQVTNTFTVAKAALTVTPNAATKVYGATLPTLSGAVTGLVNGDKLGGAILVAYSTTATASSAAGTYNITATVTGTSSADYTVTVAPAALTVTKAALTLTANSLTAVYGQGLPSLTYSITGLVNNDTAATAFTGAPALSTTATAKSSVGSYPITITAGTLASANYTVSFASGTLTFTQATLTVTPANLTSVYGSPLPTLTYTLVGLVNGDTAATATTGAATLSTSATQSSSVGQYTITAAVGTLAATNYKFSVVSGALTITKAPLTVTANPQTSVYGSVLPSLTYGITGFVNDDTAATAVTGTPTVSTTATQKSGVGAYPISVTVGTIAATNYSFTFAGNIFTVTKAPLALTANNQTSTYGANIPTLTYAVAGFVNGDTMATATTGAPSITTAATSKSPVGNYPIAAAAGTLAAPNYNLSFANGSLAVSPAPLTVTASNASGTYGSPLPALSYTIAGFVNSDTAATATTGTPTLSTTALATSPAGSYAITAAAGTLKAANYSFNFVPGTLTIAKAILTVTAGNFKTTYGSALPTFNYAITGFVNNDTVATAVTGAPTLSSTATAKSGAGTYPITVALSTLNASNYNFQTIPGALTIMQAPLTVTATNLSSVYGAALPTFPYTFSGFVNGDTPATAITGTPSFTTTATSKSPVGAYPINISVGTLASANYVLQFLPAVLTITKAPLTLTATSLNSTYGSAIPALTYTLAGFVNEDTAATATTGAPTLSTTATQKSAAGPYPITAALGTLAANNYTFTPVNGTLTVNKAVLTVTAATLSSTYGASIPTLTYTLSGFVNGDTAATAITGAASLTTTATSKSSVGLYPVTPALGTLAAANYSFQFTPGSLIVTQAPLTVVTTNASSTYGSPLPALTYTVTGFVNGDTAATATSGAASLTTTATAKSPAGSYNIVAAQGTLTSTNYSFQFVPGTLTINKAILAVAAGNLSSVYGATLPALTHTITGFVNGDTAATAVSGTPSLTTTATSKSAVGTYTITAALGSLTATNYTFTFTQGTLTITKAPLTVTASNATSIYGATLPTFAATYTGFVNADTAAAALTGAPSLTTAATSKSGAGAYPITAATGTLAAANYSFTFAPGTLTITRAALKITASNATKVYGAALPTFTYTATGLVNGDTAATAFTGAPALTTTATVKSSVGMYPIAAAVGTLVSANYSVTFAPGTLTVSKALLTVTAANLSKTYGAALPTLTYVATGLVNGDTAATAFTGVPSLTSTATAKSAAGIYPITPAVGTLVSANYSFTFVNGTLTITKAALTITASNATKVYGGALPKLTFTPTGFVNGDTAATAFTGVPALTTTATAKSAVGTYPITAAAGTLVSTNYSFTFVNGTLSITKAALTITASNATKVYGAALPKLTFTPNGFVNGDTAATAFTGVSALTTTATAKSAVGTYPITAAAGTLVSTNYSFTFVNGTLAVTKAALTITASNATKVYGAALPKLTFTPTGFVNGDTTATAFTGVPAETTTATATSAIGAYPITITQGTLASTNYTFTFVNGTLTVTAIGTASTPTFTPAAGTYSAAQTVTLADTTPGAVIYYTTNGTAPTTASTKYTTAIAVSATETVKAIAVAPGYTQSPVASAAYTIK